jgi:hypothetical protein
VHLEAEEKKNFLGGRLCMACLPDRRQQRKESERTVLILAAITVTSGSLARGVAEKTRHLRGTALLEFDVNKTF